jgi:ribosome-interacting GTPase 1
MNKVLFNYLDNFCTIYLNDILIYSDNVLKHKHHIKLVLQRLQEAGLQVNIKKTEFYVTRTKYLGFIISTQGLEVNPEKISAITN